MTSPPQADGDSRKLSNLLCFAVYSANLLRAREQADPGGAWPDVHSVHRHGSTRRGGGPDRRGARLIRRATPVFLTKVRMTCA